MVWHRRVGLWTTTGQEESCGLNFRQAFMAHTFVLLDVTDSLDEMCRLVWREITACLKFTNPAQQSPRATKLLYLLTNALLGLSTSIPRTALVCFLGFLFSLRQWSENCTCSTRELPASCNLNTLFQSSVASTCYYGDNGSRPRKVKCFSYSHSTGSGKIFHHSII